MWELVLMYEFILYQFWKCEEDARPLDYKVAASVSWFLLELGEERPLYQLCEASLWDSGDGRFFSKKRAGGTLKVLWEGLHSWVLFVCWLIGGCGWVVPDQVEWISADPSVKWFWATIVGICFSITMTITQCSGWGLPQISGGGWRGWCFGWEPSGSKPRPA